MNVLTPLIALILFAGSLPTSAQESVQDTALGAASNQTPELATTGERRTGQTVEKVPTAHDATQQYALFLPSGYGVDKREWPVLFVLDPRGRAMPGIDRFREAAERHGWIVISSYQSRSDTFRDVNYAALNALLRDVQSRYAVDMKRLYLAGMSGTAHASWRFGQALEGHVAGVIAAVGGVQTSTQGTPGDARFSYYGITGTADFNYQEMMRLEEHMLERGIAHRMVVFEGRHGWPPHEYTDRALDWMELQAIQRGLAPPNERLIDAELTGARSAADAAADPLEKLRRYRDIVRDFNGLRETEVDAQEVRRLEADPRVASRRKQEKKLAGTERAYLNHHAGRWLADLSNPDRRLPTLRESLVALRIESLQRRAANVVERYDAYSAQRSLESLYTNVSFYLPREFEKQRDWARVVRSLEVAIAINPDRPRPHWRLATAYAESGREKAALAALEKAASFGNVDLERLKTDPTWDKLRRHPEWQALIEAVASAAG